MVVVEVGWARVSVVWMVTRTVFGRVTVDMGTFVMTTVAVVERVGRVVIVEVLQPGVVSMQEQRVLTKEAMLLLPKSGASGREVQG